MGSCRLVSCSVFFCQRRRRFFLKNPFGKRGGFIGGAGQDGFEVQKRHVKEARCAIKEPSLRRGTGTAHRFKIRGTMLMSGVGRLEARSTGVGEQCEKDRGVFGEEVEELRKVRVKSVNFWERSWAFGLPSGVSPKTDTLDALHPPHHDRLPAMAAMSESEHLSPDHLCRADFP